MKRALAAFALLAMLPSAHAQDKAKGEFSHDGEFRLRDTFDLNEKGNKDSQPSHNNSLAERFKLDLGFKATEKLSANMTLLSNFAFGEVAGNDLNTPNGSNGAEDTLTVNQAYGTWMMADDFSLKFGRMNYQIGDGSLIATNDWEAVPYAFEGGLANWEAEFGKFQLMAFKFREMGRTALGTTVSGTASDAERNMYGLNFDLKTMPEWLKSVNAHVLQDTGDSGNTAASAAGNDPVAKTSDVGRNVMRYGVGAGFAFSIVDLKANYEAMNGKYHDLSSGTKVDVKTGGNMMQAELGVNFANFMGSRLFVKYHQDSGQKDKTSDKNDTYDGYFHELHCSAGCMDLFDFGNLTFAEIGLTGKPADSTEVGLSYYMFSRTEKGANTNAPVANGAQLTGTNLDKSALGNEFDLWAEHKYNSNLSTIARVSQFMPGDYYKANGGTTKDTLTQVYLEGKYSF